MPAKSDGRGYVISLEGQLHEAPETNINHHGERLVNYGNNFSQAYGDSSSGCH